jgi:hypothetical protein
MVHRTKFLVYVIHMTSMDLYEVKIKPRGSSPPRERVGNTSWVDGIAVRERGQAMFPALFYEQRDSGPTRTLGVEDLGTGNFLKATTCAVSVEGHEAGAFERGTGGGGGSLSLYFSRR